MTLPGNIDYQGQSAQSVRFLGGLAVDTVGSQAIDISNLIAPSDQALLFYWVAVAPFTGLPLGVLCKTNAPPIFFTGETQIPDGGQAIMPFQGQMVLNPVNIGATVLVDNIAGGGLHVAGTLFAFALTAPAYVLPITKGVLIGQGQTTGNIGCAAASITTVLATPLAGQYYRIKLLTFRLTAAPAAAANITWQTLLTAALMTQFICTVAASQSQTIAMDMEWHDGIRLNNGSNVLIGATILYELWQA